MLFVPGFKPEQPVAHKRQRAMHLLQTSVAPALFHPRGVYDGKSLLYVSHQLNLPGGGSGARVISSYLSARVCVLTRLQFPIRLGNDPNAAIGSPGVVEIILSKTASEIIRPT
jgi:hypothetical protein